LALGMVAVPVAKTAHAQQNHLLNGDTFTSSITCTEDQKRQMPETCRLLGS
jgi:hypothetical protein